MTNQSIDPLIYKASMASELYTQLAGLKTEFLFLSSCQNSLLPLPHFLPLLRSFPIIFPPACRPLSRNVAIPLLRQENARSDRNAAKHGKGRSARSAFSSIPFFTQLALRTPVVHVHFQSFCHKREHTRRQGSEEREGAGAGFVLSHVDDDTHLPPAALRSQIEM